MRELFCLHRNAHTATNTTVDNVPGSGGKLPLIGRWLGKYEESPLSASRSRLIGEGRRASVEDDEPAGHQDQRLQIKTLPKFMI
ncbi:hypothetical protein TNCV_1640241 [Trichonephila clavipes]|nr:hypothetical protein TNCV_1640241 [Trichonephila clavipes]